jgi:hypothetical protein
MTSLSDITRSFGRVIEEPAAEKCRIGLPSSSSVENLFDGDMSALLPVAASMVGRGALIGVGAYAAGLRGGDVARAAVGGAVVIEAFVVAWVALNRPRQA